MNASAIRMLSPLRCLSDQSPVSPVGLDLVLAEYQAAFIKESVCLPELALRYLIFLVVSDADIKQISSFVYALRLELNSVC
ncbi:hypothetical protein CN03_03330 [Thalassolituus oleivorans]|jgi:hypothetical protein|uniref:hypothetical protein n=1 Tax=Thalassolituus oleivorans TaxID=187493 RepID=UPI000949264F|nr:hypothetical protein [Thalassolituus oleivorans]APR66042.1 hypothetical protein CN03_03330 [Thalassolituus oleivorans]